MTIKTLIPFVMLATFGLAGTAAAQQRFVGVEYLAGRPDLARPFDATLVLDNRELRVEQTVYSSQGRDVRIVFTIPLADISAVGASLDQEGDSPMLTGLVGLSSPSAHREYVTLTMETGDGVEGIVFSVGRQQSVAIAGKIQSAALTAQLEPTPPAARIRAVARARRRPLHLVTLMVRASKPQPAKPLRNRNRDRSRRRADRLYSEQA